MENALKNTENTQLQKSVTFHNVFLNAIYSLDTVSKKLLIGIAHKMQKKNYDQKQYIFSANEICDLVGIGKESQKKLEHSVEKLMKTIFTIRKADWDTINLSQDGSKDSKKSDTKDENNWVKFHILGTSTYKRGELAVNVSEHMINFLFELKSHFTTYKLINIRPLKHQYSFRFYELLKQYENIGSREFIFTDLKTILQCDQKYQRYYDFKKYVLSPSKKEINRNCDISFTFDEIKKGRSVWKIVFNIKSKDFSVKENQPDLLDVPKSLDELEMEIRSHGWTGDFQKFVKDNGGFEAVEYFWNNSLKEKIEKGNFSNEKGIITKEIKDNALREYQLHLLQLTNKKRERTEKQKKKKESEAQVKTYKKKRDKDYAKWNKLSILQQMKIINEKSVLMDNFFQNSLSKILSEKTIKNFTIEEWEQWIYSMLTDEK